MTLSDISLTAGMRSNLLNLQQTTYLLNRTQERLSSGKKVNTALDNPTNYFAAQNATQRASDLSDRKDGMAEAVQTVSAATSGLRRSLAPSLTVTCKQRQNYLLQPNIEPVQSLRIFYDTTTFHRPQCREGSHRSSPFRPGPLPYDKGNTDP